MLSRVPAEWGSTGTPRNNAASALPRQRDLPPRTTTSRSLSQVPPIKAPIPEAQAIAALRFWHDEKRFRGSGDESLAQHALLGAGGVRMGGSYKCAPSQGPMGWQTADSWDVLWSTSDGAHKAAPLIDPGRGQMINALPGLEQLTRKRLLAVTLHAAYGAHAWSFVPRTYSIPAQLLQWRQRLATEAAACEPCLLGRRAEQPSAREPSAGAQGSPRQQQQQQHEPSPAAAAAEAAFSPGGIGPVTGWWVLKTGEHLGQGLQLVPSSKALSALLERNKPYLRPPSARQQQQQQQRQVLAHEEGVSSSNDSSSSSSSGSNSSNSSTKAPGPADAQQQGPAGPAVAAAGALPRPFLCAQQYVTQPLLIDGRKFGLRLWVLVVGPRPYRAYLYRQGLVLFSGQQYNADLPAVAAEGAASQGHLTNAAQWECWQPGGMSAAGNGGGGSSSSSSSSTGAADYQGQLNTLEDLLRHSSSISSSSSATGSSPGGGSNGGGPKDPREQPVWTLQQLLDVLGPDKADTVWQQLLAAAGHVVAAAARPVREAAAKLQWSGDAAFELLGLDFVLDSSLKPWLLEVNASPSLAWHTPGHPATSALMWGVKQRMVADMLAVLRLQDRFPTPGAGQPAAAEGAAGRQRQQQRAACAAGTGQLAQGGSPSSSGGRASSSGQPRRRADLNPVLLQAASKQYFASRPLAAGLVAHAAWQLQAAVAAAPTRQHVAEQVEQQLQQLERQQPQVVDAALLRRHQEQLVRVQCESQSAAVGGWHSLLPHMPTPQQAARHGWDVWAEQADEDAAVRAWLDLVVPAAVTST